MNQETKVVKISDIVENQIPEFILSENPNFSEFLKQYYISQEFQGATIDLAENLIDYKNVDSFDTKNLLSNTTLISEVGFFDDVIEVESTNGWPNQYGLLKIDDEIITYTGITSTSFTGCIRGFSATSSLSQENNQEFLVFSQTEASDHTNNIEVYNLSNLFLKEFFRKTKYQFAPGFEDVVFDENINVPNFISKIKTFYQTKGTDECYKILFKVLYNEDVQVLKPYERTFTTSDDNWIVCETFACEVIDGNPTILGGQTLYQDKSTDGKIFPANGSIYSVDRFYLKNKTFYKLNIFAGYSNNLNPKGSISGTFIETPKTYVVESIEANSSTITVDSTTGFELSGTVIINGLSITYTDKTNNQFLNCTGISSSILAGVEVYGNNYVYSYENGDLNKKVTLRILSVLSGIEYSDALYSCDKDPIQVENLGSLDSNAFTNSLLYNLPLTVFSGKLKNDLKSYDLVGIGISNGICRTLYNHNLKNNDFVDLHLTDFNQKIKENILVEYSNNLPKQYTINVSGISSYIGNNITAKRKLFKSTSDQYPEIADKFTANIQNSYTDENYNYITSNGFPSYNINPYKRESNFYVNTLDYEILIGDHNFNSGELVTINDFSIIGNYSNAIGINTGISFYVKTLSPNAIKLSYSKSNVGVSSFVNFSELVNPPIDNSVAGYVSNLTLIDKNLYANNFTSSKLFKKIPKIPTYSTEKNKTLPGSVGVFVNGIEIQNYKSNDSIYYGYIENINILNPGNNYDLTNPPQFIVDGGNDMVTSLIPQLKGSIKELVVTNPGFNYEDTPIVIVSGGNSNSELKTEVKMKLASKILNFNASPSAGYVSDALDKFIFKDKHGLITGEGIIYQAFNNSPIGIGTQISDGYLINDGIYYVINVGAGTSFKLAKSKEDAFLNTYLPIREYGSGSQRFVSTDKKKIIDKVNIVDTDINFEYKKVFAIKDNLHYQDNIIVIDNHGFEDNEEVVYSFGGQFGQALDGLSLNVNYYIKKIDNNQFKLKSSKYSSDIVPFGQSDSNTIHYFEYSPIKVSVNGTLAVDSNNNTIGEPAEIKAIVTGEVYEIKIENSKSYGITDVLNYQLPVYIEELTGSGANLQPLIYNGEIDQVIVKSSGSYYYNTIKLEVVGSGYGAILEPIIVDGKITNVSIVNPGIGYDASTNIKIVTIGNNLKVSTNLTSWTLNEIAKLKKINTDKGVLLGKTYSQFGNIFGLFYLNVELLDTFQIPSLNSNESPSKHSPIIGWAYDGCPIYGPDGYKNINGTGKLKRLKSSYKFNKKGPPTFEFIEDYEYVEGVGDLDEYNGRFCVTPEFPNGIYAYFCTISNDRTPIFPYIIGNNYKFSPEQDNFDIKINQNKDLNSLNLSKHTLPYGVEDKNHYYEYINFNGNKYKKDIIVTDSSRGQIDDVLILNGGESYKINDKIIFDNSNTDGFGALAKVSEISGVGITSISSSSQLISNVTFTYSKGKIVGIASTSHSLVDSSYVQISGISSSTYSNLEGFKKIYVPVTTTNLTESIPNQSITGLTTSIKVKDSIFNFEVDSMIKVGNETMKVIRLDYLNNSINVLRETGAPLHSYDQTVELLEKKFYFDCSEIISLPDKNESYYFNPSQSVGIGTTTAVGSGTTLAIYPLGMGVSQTKFVQSGGIFLPNHKFKSGDKLTYTKGQTSINVSNNGSLDSIAELYVVDLGNSTIGLTSDKTKVTSTDNLLLFTSTENNNLHKFATNRNVVTGNIISNQTKVTTSSTHNLSVGDQVNIKVNSGITTTFIVSYDEERLKLLINSSDNPLINLYDKNIVIFDTSSITLTGCTFKLYVDKEFNNEYFGNIENGIEVQKTSTSVKLTISEYTPKFLYYNIESDTKNVYSNILIPDYNTIKISKSLYNFDNLNIVSSSTNQFTVNYPLIPERSSYESDSSTLSYSISLSNVNGPINKVKLISKGSNYKKLPKINLIEGNGTNANLLPISTTIGKITNSKVINSEFIVPTDKTLSPFSNTYLTTFLYKNFTVDKLEIISRGGNYLNPPNTILYSKENNKIVSDFSALVSIKSNSLSEIQIINPSSGLLSTDDQLVFVDNSNGIKILGGSYNSGTVTLTLETPAAGFTTSNPLPFTIGDQIFIEGVKSIGNGYNSSDYQYQLFTLTGITTAYDSPDAAQLQYILPKNPGFFDENLSINATVVNSKYLPEVKVYLKENIFYNNEPINDTQIIDNVNNDPLTKLLKLNNPTSLKVTDQITGSYSNSKGTICRIESYNTALTSNVSVPQIIGWRSNRGKLSDSIQKLQDNDYYQKFSYSLKSKKQISDWNSIVSDVSHVAGYKKFSDLIVESGPSTNISSITAIDSSNINISLNSYVNVNSISNYDLVSENVEDYNNEGSDIIKFNSKILTDYILSKENRVLSIDDISNLFDNTIPQTVKILVDQIIPTDLNASKSAVKYLFLVQASSSFSGNFIYPMFFEMVLTRNGNDINLTSYSYFFNKDLGNISAEINPTTNSIIDVYFTPINANNSILVRALRDDASDVIGITTTSYGYDRNVAITTSYASEVIPTQKTIYSIPLTESVSGTMFVGITSIQNRVESFVEMSFLYNNGTLDYNVYSESEINQIGTIGITTNNSNNLIITYDGVSGVGVTVFGNFDFITNTLTSPSTILTEFTRLNSSSVTYTGSSAVAITTVSTDYSASKYIIEVSKTIGITTQKSLIAFDAIHYNKDSYLNNVNYSILGNIDDLNFVTNYDDVNNCYILSYEPNGTANYNIKFFEKNILGIII
jgi:hypothetical protein